MKTHPVRPHSRDDRTGAARPPGSMSGLPENRPQATGTGRSPSPGGIVRTVEFDGAPGHVCLETVTFTERGDTTVVTQDTVYQSVQDRDRVLHYDMAEDISESVDRLEELLARLVPVS